MSNVIISCFYIGHHKTDQSGVTLHLVSKKCVNYTKFIFYVIFFKLHDCIKLGYDLFFRPKHFAGIYLVAAGGPPVPPRQSGNYKHSI